MSKRGSLRPVLVFAWRGIVRRRLQTTLLVFALSIALAGTMTIMAILSGIDVQMRKDLSRVGVDVINIHVSPELKNFFISPLKLRDVNEMRAQFGGVLAPFRVSMGMSSTTGDKSAQVLALSTTPEWGNVVPLEYLQGRFFEVGEKDVCVLDQWVAETLFGEHKSAIGRELTIRSLGAPRQLRVVGVMKDPFEIRKKFDELDVTGSARSRMVRMMEFKSIYVSTEFDNPDMAIHGAVLKVPPGSDSIQIASQIRDWYSSDNSSVWIWARKKWVDNVLRAAEFSLQLANVIWVIVLFVTGIMIMTVSLVAVRERYREIAIRRTEGARRGQVALQLLLENVLLSLIAGIIAIGLAHWGGSVIESRYISWPPAFLPSDMLLALGCGVVMAGLATVLPALRAGSLDPVAVLKNT